MRRERSVQVATRVALDRIRNEYAHLLQSETFSLQQLFNPDGFRLDQYCTAFSPHPQSEELQKMAEKFGREHGIWLDNARHYITCTLFLYPDAEFDRMAAIVKNNAIDYYLNDTMGRDVYKFLSFRQQEAAELVIQRMAELTPALDISKLAEPLEIANIEVLTHIRETSPYSWFSEFLRFYAYHIGVTHKDLNAASLEYIPSISEYIDMRNHTSGMHHIVLLIEYNQGLFLDWDLLSKIKMTQPLRRLHWLIATFGCLSNDLFSFEREVIDNGTDSNLVAILMLNRPDMSLKEAFFRAATMVRELIFEYIGLLKSCKDITRTLQRTHPAEAEKMQNHLNGIERCIQASWIWQVHTKRYKRDYSIWEETTLPVKMRKAV